MSESQPYNEEELTHRKYSAEAGSRAVYCQTFQNPEDAARALGYETDPVRRNILLALIKRNSKN